MMTIRRVCDTGTTAGVVATLTEESLGRPNRFLPTGLHGSLNFVPRPFGFILLSIGFFRFSVGRVARLLVSRRKPLYRVKVPGFTFPIRLYIDPPKMLTDPSFRREG